MSNKSLSGLFDREQDLTGADLMLISQLTAAGWKSAQVTLEDFFTEMFQPTSTAGQLVAGIRTDLDDLENRFNMHENPSLNTTNPNYDPHGGFFLQHVTLRSTDSGLEGNGRTENPLGIDYDYLNTIYARYSQVVNNLTSTSATLPLSANQGRVLDTTKSDISEVRKNFGSNFVGVVATTGYNLNNAAVGDYVYIDKGVATVTNAPPFQYSTTFTECSHLTTASRFQVARDYITGQFAVRGLQNGTWSAWRKQLLEGDSTSSVGSADKLTTARRINNVLFDGSQDITVYAEKPFNGTIANSTAENAATTPGYYTYTDTNTVTGLGAAGVDGWLEVIVVDDTIIQIRQTIGDVDYASDAMPAKTARRVKVGAGAWSSWMPMGPRTTAATTAEYGVTRLVNTLTSTADNNALTAAMGKQLQDTKANLASLRSEFGNRPIDLIVPNTYNWNNIVPGDFVFLNVAGTTNPPPFATCSVYCEKSYQGSGERFVMAREYSTGRLAVRARQNNVWGGWITLLSSTDLANGITNHKAESDPHPQYLTQADVDSLALGGLVEHVLDLSSASFDVNTYYPVTISIAGQGRCNFEIDTPLGYAPAPWSTHGGGTISVVGKWSEYGSGWGGNSIQRTIDAFGWQFCVNSPIIGIGQMSQSSNVVFYARGRTKYRIKMTKGLVPVIRTSAYTANSQTVSPKAFDNTVPVSIQDQKLNASHLNDANPHPQYALSTAVDGLYPRAGGEITGNVQIGGSGGARNLTVTGETFLASTGVTGNLDVTGDLETRWLYVGDLNPNNHVGLNVSSQGSISNFWMTYGADVVDDNPLFSFAGRLAANNLFGDEGYVWRNQMGIRSHNTSFLNTTGSTMWVSAGFKGTENNDQGSMYATVDGNVVQRIYNHATNATSYLSYNWFFFVPAGSWYRIVCDREKYYWEEYSK